MRSSWTEVRSGAASIAKALWDAAYETGEMRTFYRDFSEVSDIRLRSAAPYEEHVPKLDNRRVLIDLFWPGVQIIEQKSPGRDLDKAQGQPGK